MNECSQKSAMNGNTHSKTSLPGSVIGCVGSTVLGPCVLDSGEVVDGEPQIISIGRQNSRFKTCSRKTLEFFLYSFILNRYTIRIHTMSRKCKINPHLNQVRI